jgi:hypothetical protein
VGPLSWTGSLMVGVPLRWYTIELDPNREELDRAPPVAFMGSIGLALGPLQPEH